MDVLKISFILLLVSFPLGEVARFQFGNGVAYTINTVFVGLTSVIWFWQGLFNKGFKKYFSISFVRPIGIFISLALLSLLVNLKELTLSQGSFSLLYLLRWILYVVIFFVVIHFDKSFKEKIKKFVVFIGALIVFAGFLQYIFYPNLKGLFYLGWDEHMHRMFSTFLDPNYLGAYLVLFFLYIFSFFIKRPSMSYGLLMVFTIIAVLLTFSRSAILMLIVSFFIYLVMIKKTKWLLSLIGVILIFFVAISKFFYIENINPFRIVSTEARLETMRNAITIFKDHPILGVGFNGYKYSQIQYGFRKEINARQSHADAAPDNSFLFILATTGIVGFAAYIYLWVKILKDSNALVLACVIGLFVNSLFINSLFYPFIMVWMWIIIGLNQKRN